MAPPQPAPARPRTGGAHQRGTDLQDWHVLQRSLPPVPASVRLARMTTRVACRAWRAPAAEEPAALVASELVSLVLQHSRRSPLTLRVRMTPRRLRIEVYDPTALLPPHLDAVAVAIVDATAVRWGVAPRPGGAELWADLALGA